MGFSNYRILRISFENDSTNDWDLDDRITLMWGTKEKSNEKNLCTST